MSDPQNSSDVGPPDPEATLRDLDPVLNVFALANGLDLHRNVSGEADRVLGWYREGLERLLRIEAGAEDGSGYTLTAEAADTRPKPARIARRELARDVPAETLRRELRALLQQGVDRANALAAADLE